VFRIIIIITPLLIYEMLTSHNLIVEIATALSSYPLKFMSEERSGLWRAQGPFGHPILLGVCCGGIFGLTHFVIGYERSFFSRWSRSALVIIAAMTSLSSGPMSALAVQMGLVLWNWVLGGVKRRWMLLWLLIATMWTSITIFSNQSVYSFYIYYAPLFDKGTAYFRILIWNYGTASVLKHPLFGIGYNEYERLPWMVPSIDMFWLLHAMMYGLPAAFLFTMAFALTLWGIGLKKGLSERVLAYRTGYLISMASFFIAGWAVHFWEATYTLFLFLLGSGTWILDEKQRETGIEEVPMLNTRRDELRCARRLHAAPVCSERNMSFCTTPSDLGASR
jgi:hypothetical protein